MEKQVKLDEESMQTQALSNTRVKGEKHYDADTLMKGMASLGKLMEHYIQAQDLMQQMQLGFASEYLKGQINAMGGEQQDKQRVILSHMRRAWYEEKALKGFGFDLKKMIERQIKYKTPKGDPFLSQADVRLDEKMVQQLEHLLMHWERCAEYTQIQGQVPPMDEGSGGAHGVGRVKKL